MVTPITATEIHVEDIPWDELPILDDKPKLRYAQNEVEPTTKVMFRWSTMHTDPTPYKVFASELLPQEVFIGVEVPNRFILSSTLNSDDYSSETVLTPAGYAYVQRLIAEELKKSYDEMTGGI